MGTDKKETINSTVKKGQQVEDSVKAWLINKGLTPLAIRFRIKGGEIDLVMKDHETIVFIEVRFRSCSTYGDALETIDYFKQQRLLKTAQVFLTQNALVDLPCRFDIVAITGKKWTWLRNAFNQ